MADGDFYKIRHLTVDELGLPLPSAEADDRIQKPEIEPRLVTSLLQDENEILQTVRDVMRDGYAGAIFSGPPGTGKTWYARQVALTLAQGNPEQVSFVQFHPSYQYEDFVYGFDPSGNGWVPGRRVFAELCSNAFDDPERLYVLVIDEFSRTDVARVFGEVLTYIEVSKRGMPFTLQSGEEMVVPPNLFILATMNPWDRGVDDLDVAMERRFATVDFPPDPEVLAKHLEGTSLTEAVRSGLLKFFSALQKQDNDQCRIGHAYFNYVSDEASLERLWRFRLLPHFKRASRLDRGLLQKLEGMWRSMVLSQKTGQANDSVGEPASSDASTDVQIGVAERIPEA